MKVVTVHEAKTHLSRLLRECAEGEEIVIARGNRPVARLTRVATAASARQLGLHAGQLELADDFDAPLPDFADYR